jgi:hypothetical protein
MLRQLFGFGKAKTEVPTKTTNSTLLARQNPHHRDLDLGEEHRPALDFDQIVDQITALKPRAQATFLFRLTEKLSPKLLKTLKFYTNKHLASAHDLNQRSQNDHAAAEAAAT